MTEQYVGLGKRGWLNGFDNAGNEISWQIDAPSAGLYEIAILGGGHGSRGNIPQVEVTVGGTTLQASLNSPEYWRQTIGTVNVPAGQSSVSIRLANNAPLDKFYSVELVRPSAKLQMEQEAAASRAGTSWLLDGKYGFMFHWTSQSQPRRGKAKSYQQAVRDFDLDGFVDSVDKMGAGHVIFTTSHAGFWFPGPNDAIDKILPGRTSQRDLIGEMADALNERGIKLMLYFHPGHDDKPWWDAVGYDQDKTAFYQTWQDLIADAGNRYGDRLAGWFFDDGHFTYYPDSPDWKAMTKASRAGNPDRLVSYNSWQFASSTPYQDVFFGESGLSHEIIQGFGNLDRHGSGILTGGRYKGLQSHIMTITEGDWVHTKPDTEIGPVIHKLNDLVRAIKESISYGTVPTFNLEIYQDGSLSDDTVELFNRVSAAIHDGQMPEGM
jgi:hypothetical protein